MRIYVDFDDCLCETGRAFSKLAAEMFGKNVGSSRKVVGFQPGNRQSEVTNEGKEILIVSIAVADTLSHLDFVVEALQFACADRKNGMSGKTVQT